jgi:hypothetical protein
MVVLSLLLEEHLSLNLPFSKVQGPNGHNLSGVKGNVKNFFLSFKTPISGWTARGSLMLPDAPSASARTSGFASFKAAIRGSTARGSLIFDLSQHLGGTQPYLVIGILQVAILASGPRTIRVADKRACGFFSFLTEQSEEHIENKGSAQKTNRKTKEEGGKEEARARGQDRNPDLRPCLTFVY